MRMLLGGIECDVASNPREEHAFIQPLDRKRDVVPWGCSRQTLVGACCMRGWALSCMRTLATLRGASTAGERRHVVDTGRTM